MSNISTKHGVRSVPDGNLCRGCRALRRHTCGCMCIEFGNLTVICGQPIKSMTCLFAGRNQTITEVLDHEQRRCF